MANCGTLNVDDILQYAGDFGKYQIFLLSLFSLTNILSAFHYFGQTFISVESEHSCKLPLQVQTADDIVSQSTSKNVTVSDCKMTVYKYDSNNNSLVTNVEKCKSGWIFNNTNGFVTIIEEMNWVCDDNWKPVNGQSAFFIGSVVGTLLFGILADKIGRLHVLIVANILAMIGNLLTMYSTNITIFCVTRFLAGCATDSNFVMMYIIVMEYMSPRMRTFGLNICIGIFYGLACVVIPWIAVFTGNWRRFLLAISIPHTVVLGFYCLVPESAQWLISKGEIAKALHIFSNIARTNGNVISDDVMQGLKIYYTQSVSSKHTENENVFGLFRTPKLRMKMLILILKSMVMTLCYDAISRHINGLDYSPFFIFSIASLTILPACLIILATQDRIGRKALASGSLLFCALFTFMSGFIQYLNLLYRMNIAPWIVLVLSIISRLSINVAYNSGAQYAVELIPTVVRGQGVSLVHVVGYAVSFFSPQLLYLHTFWQPLPDMMLSCLLLSGAVACLFLPETLNRSLPITLDDGEQFGNDESVFQFACCRRKTQSTIT